jgi:TonB family protein
MSLRLGWLLFCCCAVAAPAEDEWVVQRIVGADYPALAQQARIQGMVELTCRVDVTGRIIKCDSANGHLLLRNAAIENAKKWAFWRQAGDANDGNQVQLRYEFVLQEGTPVRRQPKVEFSFEFPNHARIVSEIPCAEHLPCTPEEFERLQKPQLPKSKRQVQ